MFFPSKSTVEINCKVVGFLSDKVGLQPKCGLQTKEKTCYKPMILPFNPINII